ncbi:MAG: S8 family serine peptidase [Thermomicrobiales bacterium]
MTRPRQLSRIVALLVMVALLAPLLRALAVQAGAGQSETDPSVARFEDDGDDEYGDIEIDADYDEEPPPEPDEPVEPMYNEEEFEELSDDDDGDEASSDDDDQLEISDDDDGGFGTFDDHDDDDDVGAGSVTVGAEDTRGRRSGVVIDDDDDPNTSGYYAGEIIVRLVNGGSIDAFNERHGTRTIAAIDSRALYLVQLPTNVDYARIEAELVAHGDTVWAELNYVNEAPEGRPGYFFTSSAPEVTDANDQYALDVIGVEAARSRATGSGVVVAVLDTGVDATHPALLGRVLTTGWNVLAGNDDTRDIGNSLDDDADGVVDEMVGHGTHVAGIVVQVAPGATILPITVLNSDGVGDAFFLASGIYQAIDRGADVINLSLGSTHDAIIVEEAIAEALAHGVSIVAAAGNAATDDPVEYPAAFPHTIGVAATDDQDRKSDFSNFGETVTIAAPGEDIVSAVPGDGLEAWGGTSMATAFVAGAAALITGGNPELLPEQVRDRLMSTAEDISGVNPDFDGELGAGRLDVAAAAGCP